MDAMLTNYLCFVRRNKRDAMLTNYLCFVEEE